MIDYLILRLETYPQAAGTRPDIGAGRAGDNCSAPAPQRSD